MSVSDVETFEDLRALVVDQAKAPFLEYFYSLMKNKIPNYIEKLSPELAVVYKPVYNIIKDMGLLDLPYEVPFQYTFD